MEGGRPGPGRRGRWLDGKTAHQLQDLPTDPQALAAMFFKLAAEPDVAGEARGTSRARRQAAHPAADDAA